MQGVRKVLQVGESAVAVVADTWWQAKVALDALPIEWDEGENAKVSSASIAEMLKGGLDAEQAFVGNQNGDVKAAIAGAAKKVEAVYSYPFLNHAPMEPMNATARYTPDKCEVWVPTQDGEASFAATLAASGLPAEKCEVYKINLGGGFGRRGAFQDYVTQAVLIAKQMPGTPVKLMWSREEDMAQGRYHPVMQCKLTGGLDANDNLTGLHMRLSGQSILAAVRPRRRAAEGPRPGDVPGAEPTRRAFARLQHAEPADRPRDAQHARAAGVLARRQHQPERDLPRVLHGRAGARGRPGPARVPPQAHGRACRATWPCSTRSPNDRLGQAGAAGRSPRPGADEGLQQLRRRGVRDLGEGRQQGEGAPHRRAPPIPATRSTRRRSSARSSGSFVYGLSALFMQESTVKDGRIEQDNFHAYPSMRIAQMPKVETIIMPGRRPVWGGVGEPTICVAAPAVLNAYFRATGKRVRTSR